MLLGTGIIAVLVRYTFPYHWSWTEALLFGAMMAATDPVATVAVLGQVRSRQIGRSVEACCTAVGKCPMCLAALSGTGFVSLEVDVARGKPCLS